MTPAATVNIRLCREALGRTPTPAPRYEVLDTDGQLPYGFILIDNEQSQAAYSDSRELLERLADSMNRAGR